MWIDTNHKYAYNHYGAKIAGDKDSLTTWGGAWRDLAVVNAEATVEADDESVSSVIVSKDVEEKVQVSENIKEDTGLGTIKFSKGKVQFLILQSTSSDYRITFLATEKKWSTILTGVKGVSIPKNAKGNKWLKYVNKGIGETSVIKSFIRESVKGANEEIANILKAKEEEKQRRAEAKKLAKKQAQEENK
jgi:hypothetical protein